MTKIYQLDEHGFLIGETVWDVTDTPVTLAQNETTEPPPKTKKNEVAVYRGGWTTVAKDEHARFVDQEALFAQRRDKLAATSARRWAEQEAGVAVDGVTYSATHESFNNMLSTLAYLERLPAADDKTEPTVNWKAANNTTATLTHTQLEAAALAVGAHIQRLFDWETTVVAQITAATTVADLAAVSLTPESEAV